VIVVADTSVLLNVALLGLDGLLADMFGEVWIPDAVEREFIRMAASSGRFGGLKLPANCRTRHVARLHPSVAADSRLDIGEAEALSLAVETGAGAVLLDEVNARNAALHLALTAIGTVGLLLMAKQRGSIAEVGPLLRQLIVQGQFRLSGSLVHAALLRAGELP
jgi:predicted nucleic acid-binding protein